MRVTAKKLVDAGAMLKCDWMKWFKTRWPSGCETTLKNLEAVAENIGKLCWFADFYLNDIQFGSILMEKHRELNRIWESRRGQRIIDEANRIVKLFIFRRVSKRYTVKRLQARREIYEYERAAAYAIIAKKLARMVYDKIKHGAVKKRRPK